jgi:hypothetical protein
MKQFVLAITGPAGAGKTTVGEKVAKKLERCVNIDVDHIKHMIVGGFYKDDDNPAGWGFNQWGLVGDSIGILAANFLNEGYSIIINGYIDEPGWTNIEKRLTINHKVLLLPQLEKVISRDSERHNDKALGEASVREHYKTFSTESLYKSFEKIDTTNQTIDETADSILSVVG